MKLVGANASATVTGADELPGKSNYFIGNDPKKWRTNVPTYAKVKYAGVYPGVDLVYYGNQGGQLEYDFVVAPGADPNQIKLNFAGTEGMRIDAASGDLVLKLGEDEVRFHKPVVYQPTLEPLSSAPSPSVAAASGLDPSHSFPLSGIALDSSFVLAGNNEVAFRVAGYDPTRALVIDPELFYSTFLGGSNIDYGNGIAVDSSGNAYVAGFTQSSTFPTAAPNGGTPLNGTWNSNYGTAFVSKLDPSARTPAQTLVYSTYLGGSWYDIANGIAVDSSGNAYVTGQTYSSDFPTVNPYQSYGGGGDAFVSKISVGFLQVPGNLTNISVGSDGTVWGIGNLGQIWMYNPQSQTWLEAPGQLTQIAVGASGFVWGLNSAGNIYRYDPGTQNWDLIPGNLAKIAVGHDGDVWGINSAGQVWHFNPQTQNWDPVPGVLTQIAVGNDGAVWGLNGGQIWRFNPGIQNWQQVPGNMAQIAVGADGDVLGD